MHCVCSFVSTIVRVGKTVEIVENEYFINIMSFQLNDIHVQTYCVALDIVRTNSTTSFVRKQIMNCDMNGNE